MRIPEEARATAADLSDVAGRFLDYAVAYPDCARLMEERPDHHLAWREEYSYPLQAWPTFVGEQKAREIRHATVEITRLAKGVLERILKNDPREICNFYGIKSEELVALLLAEPTGIEEGLARVDFVDSQDGFLCLEVNMGAYIGGWQLRFWEGLCRTHPALVKFFAENDVTPRYEDPLNVLFKHLVEEAARKRISDGGFLNTILAVPKEEVAPTTSLALALNQSYSSVLAQGGLEGKIQVCSYPDSFSARRGELYFRGADRIHAVLEHSDDQTPLDVYRCFKAGTVSLYNGPMSQILRDKKTLALLSEHQESDVFNEEEKAVLRKHLPWCRVLAPGGADYRGEAVDLLELVLGRREGFVIKHGARARGEGVVVGRMTPADRWEAEVRSAIETREWIVQEYVTSRPYLYHHGEGACLHDAVWGLFCFGSSYGGGFLRVMPYGRGDGIINSARGASEGLIFEV